MLERLQRLQAQHPVIGEVRGGHGLFAVIELVRDRATRAPLSPWDQRSPLLTTLLADALRSGVSFAARGNLIILAPPLVIEERALAQALDLLDELLGGLEQRLSPEAAGASGYK
jgi:taurine--2-oxoglutarate transaminase